jgi:hypothetical protein
MEPGLLEIVPYRFPELSETKPLCGRVYPLFEGKEYNVSRYLLAPACDGGKGIKNTKIETKRRYRR